MANSCRTLAQDLLLTARSATPSSSAAPRLSHAQGWAKTLLPKPISSTSSSSFSSFSTFHGMRSSSSGSGSTHLGGTASSSGLSSSSSSQASASSLWRIWRNPRTRAALIVGGVLVAATDVYVYTMHWSKTAEKGHGDEGGQSRE
ncbi:hypothetical protein VTH82DRAFT_7418 [Thermothelomyces myriococcoides]